MGKINPNKVIVNRFKEFFFDTNIWILLFAPNGDYRKADQVVYSKLLDSILEKNSPIYINSIIISEYANAVLRRDYKIWIDEQKRQGIYDQIDFKRHFFKTKTYLSSFDLVDRTLKDILNLPNIIKLSDDFSSTNFEDIKFACPDLDFNDSYIAYLVNKRKFCFVTNDSDFKDSYLNNELITNK